MKPLYKVAATLVLAGVAGHAAADIRGPAVKSVEISHFTDNTLIYKAILIQAWLKPLPQ